MTFFAKISLTLKLTDPEWPFYVKFSLLGTTLI